MLQPCPVSLGGSCRHGFDDWEVPNSTSMPRRSRRCRQSLPRAASIRTPCPFRARGRTGLSRFPCRTARRSAHAPQPSAIRLPTADGAAHPADLDHSIRPGPAAPTEIVGECQVRARLDAEVMELEDARAGAHRKACLPVPPVGLPPLEPQTGDRVERHDLQRVERHDAVDIAEAHRVRPVVDQAPHLRLVITGHDPCRRHCLPFQLEGTSLGPSPSRASFETGRNRQSAGGRFTLRSGHRRSKPAGPPIWASRRLVLS